MSTISCNYLSRIGLHVSSDAVGRERPEKVHDDEHMGEEERDVAARLRNLFLVGGVRLMIIFGVSV